MLYLIPAPLHRALLRLAHGLRRRWWKLRRPRLDGCRVLALDGQGRVLLIRHTYGSPLWMLPGGGLDRDEAPIAGAVRELQEETGCALLTPRLLEVTTEQFHGAHNTVHLVCGWTHDAPRADGREILVARLFAPDALPPDMPEWLCRQLPGWLAQASKD